TLTVSTATVDHTATETVNGCPGLRWIKGGGSSVVSSITVAGNLTASGSTGAITLTGPDKGSNLTNSGGAAVSNMDFTRLDSTVDGEYELSGVWVADDGSQPGDTNLVMQPIVTGTPDAGNVAGFQGLFAVGTYTVTALSVLR